MTTLAPEPILSIAAPADLNASTVPAFREQARAVLEEGHTQMDVDMQKTTFLDSSGLGALISLHKLMNARGGKIRLLNTRPQIQQIIELTRLHRILEIVRH